MIVFITGLPGTGKSTIGKMLAKHLGWQFLDMDDALPEEHRAYNRRGLVIPPHLLDAFIPKFFEHIEEMSEDGDIVVSCVLAKKEYVDLLEDMFPERRAVYLYADFPVLLERTKRKDHFFNEKLLESVYGSAVAVVPPFPRVNAEKSVDEVFRDCLFIITKAGVR